MVLGPFAPEGVEDRPVGRHRARIGGCVHRHWRIGDAACDRGTGPEHCEAYGDDQSLSNHRALLSLRRMCSASPITIAAQSPRVTVGATIASPYWLRIWESLPQA